METISYVMTALGVLIGIGMAGNTDGLGLEDVGVAVERSFIQINERMATNVPGVYAIGDVTGRLLLAHVASAPGVLDPQATAAIEALLRKVAGDGVKVVLVTHDRDQARRMADEVVFLHRGRIAERAAAHRFFDAPQSPEAQAYLAGRLLV